MEKKRKNLVRKSKQFVSGVPYKETCVVIPYQPAAKDHEHVYAVTYLGNEGLTGESILIECYLIHCTRKTCKKELKPFVYRFKDCPFKEIGAGLAKSLYGLNLDKR